jgi:hypothetical protein
VSHTTTYKRIDREKLIQFLDGKRQAFDTYGIVAISVFDGMYERITRGDFDLPEQQRCAECGRFTKVPHEHANIRASSDSAGAT